MWGSTERKDMGGVMDKESKDPFCKATAAAELGLAERLIGVDSRARLGNALKTLRKRASPLTQRVVWEVSSGARPCKRLRKKTHPEEV